jgi:hypothetical protein
VTTDERSADQARRQFDGIRKWKDLYEWASAELSPRDLPRDLRKQLKEHGWDGSDYSAVTERLETRIQEDPLSIEVGGWWAPGSSADPSEFRILLCTGGPAVRIVGTLNRHGEPDGAEIEHQDWFTPWQSLETDSSDSAVLVWYANFFYYGEG